MIFSMEKTPVGRYSSGSNAYLSTKPDVQGADCFGAQIASAGSTPRPAPRGQLNSYSRNAANTMNGASRRCGGGGRGYEGSYYSLLAQGLPSPSGPAWGAPHSNGPSRTPLRRVMSTPPSTRAGRSGPGPKPVSPLAFRKDSYQPGSQGMDKGLVHTGNLLKQMRHGTGDYTEVTHLPLRSKSFHDGASPAARPSGPAATTHPETQSLRVLFDLLEKHDNKKINSSIIKREIYKLLNGHPSKERDRGSRHKSAHHNSQRGGSTRDLNSSTSDDTSGGSSSSDSDNSGSSSDNSGSSSSTRSSSSSGSSSRSGSTSDINGGVTRRGSHSARESTPNRLCAGKGRETIQAKGSGTRRQDKDISDKHTSPKSRAPKKDQSGDATETRLLQMTKERDELAALVTDMQQRVQKIIIKYKERQNESQRELAMLRGVVATWVDGPAANNCPDRPSVLMQSYQALLAEDTKVITDMRQTLEDYKRGLASRDVAPASSDSRVATLEEENSKPRRMLYNKDRRADSYGDGPSAISEYVHNGPTPNRHARPCSETATIHAEERSNPDDVKHPPQCNLSYDQLVSELRKERQCRIQVEEEINQVLILSQQRELLLEKRVKLLMKQLYGNNQSRPCASSGADTPRTGMGASINNLREESSHYCDFNNSVNSLSMTSLIIQADLRDEPDNGACGEGTGNANGRALPMTSPFQQRLQRRNYYLARYNAGDRLAYSQYSKDCHKSDFENGHSPSGTPQTADHYYGVDPKSVPSSVEMISEKKDGNGGDETDLNRQKPEEDGQTELQNLARDSNKDPAEKPEEPECDERVAFRAGTDVPASHQSSPSHWLYRSASADAPPGGDWTGEQQNPVVPLTGVEDTIAAPLHEPKADSATQEDATGLASLEGDGIEEGGIEANNLPLSAAELAQEY